MSIFNTEDHAQLLHAIVLAENRTSGEIRIAVEKRSKTEPLKRAAYYFNKLGMHETSLRNGVLIYMAVEDHTFAIIGDVGINTLVPVDFWDESKLLMLAHFKKGNLVDGLIEGVNHVGMQLKKLFPVAEDDINELPNDIIIGED